MIAAGESVTIPAGRVAVLPNVQVDGILTIESGGDVFIPTGSTMSQVIPRVTSTDNAIVRFDGTTGAVQNSAITIDDSGNIGGGIQSFNGFGGSGFKNLIINGRKQVNQSGLTVTDNAYNYDNHYKVGNNWFMFIDGKNIISGEPYTLSWVGTATAGYYIGTAGATTINAQTFIPIANGGTITPTITSSQILWIKFASDATGSTYNKVQFEPGIAPTPYEQRLYELEEFFVQSCYEKVSNISVMFPWSSGTQFVRAFGTFKINKRVFPIISYTKLSGTGTMVINSNYNGYEVIGNGGFQDTVIYSAIFDARPY